jgi:ADP-heptose:LPS heptosyltransferase
VPATTTPQFVFVVRLSAIGDTLIAAQSVLDIVAQGHTPILCTNPNCLDVALAIPGLEYCILNTPQHGPSCYKLVSTPTGRAKEPIALKTLQNLLGKSATVLDLQSTRRSKRFMKALKQSLNPTHLTIHSVQKHTLHRAFLVAKSFFARKQTQRNAQGSLFIVPANLHRVSNLNRAVVEKFLQKSLEKTEHRILPSEPLPETENTRFWEAPYAVLCPGASLPLKSWDAAHFAQLASLIEQQTNLGIVVLGGPDDAETGSKIIHALSTQRAQNFAGKLSLGQSLTVLARARYVVSGDSFPGHACNLLGVPATLLFGATSPAFGFVPEASNIRVRWRELSCSPCTRHGRGKCRFGNRRCLVEIKPEDVLQDLLFEMGTLP